MADRRLPYRAVLVVLCAIAIPPSAWASPACRVAKAGVNAPAIEDRGWLHLRASHRSLMQGTVRQGYCVALRAGETARITVEQDGIDLGVLVLGPAGDTITAIDSPNGGAGPESVIIVATRTGDYQIVLEPGSGPDGRGHYEIELRARHTTERRDQRSFDAQSRYVASLPFRSNAPGKVLDLLNASRALARDAGDNAQEARDSYLIGEAKWHLGEISAAADAWTATARIAALLTDRGLEAAALSARGKMYLRLGDVVSARTDLMSADAILARTSDAAARAINDGLLAELAVQTGDVRSALTLYDRLLVVARASGDPLREGVTLNDMASAYQRAGDFARARRLYEQALDLVRRFGDARNVAATLNNLAGVALATGDVERAIGYLRESLSREGAITPYARAVTLGRLGQAYARAGRLDSARATLELALAQRQERDISGRAFVLQQLGAVFSAGGEYDRALDSYEQALALRRRAAQRAGEADVLYGMTGVLLARGKIAEAADRIRETVAIVETLRWNVGSRGLQAFFTGSVREYYQREIDVLMALHRASPTAGHDVRAFEASERGRARSLMEFLNDAQARPEAPSVSGVIDSQRALRQLLAVKAERQVRLATRVHSPDEAATLARDVEELSRQYDKVEGEIERTNARAPDIAIASPPTLGGIQELLDDDTVLLEYALGDQRSYAWIISRHSFASVMLPSANDLGTAARRVHKQWSGATPTPAGAGASRADTDVRALSAMLIDPVAGHLNALRVFVVPDGALHYVPFASLLLNGEPLISQHQIAMLPSGAVLGRLRAIRGTRPSAPKTLAVLADPVYDVGDPRVRARRTAAAPPRVARPGQATRAVAGDADDPPLARLAFSGVEARSILALVPRSKRLGALGFDATRAKALSPALSEFRIVHFAAHAVLNRGYANLSGIVLSLVDADGQRQPGLLSLLDVASLNLRADVVVLSACQTAVGEEVPGEGLMSLARGFMRAGASGVVASLWEVDDAATAEFMRRFYSALLDGRSSSPAAALRTAQREMMVQPRWHEPHYWAGFVLLGE